MLWTSLDLTSSGPTGHLCCSLSPNGLDLAARGVLAFYRGKHCSPSQVTRFNLFQLFFKSTSQRCHFVSEFDFVSVWRDIQQLHIFPHSRWEGDPSHSISVIMEFILLLMCLGLRVSALSKTFRNTSTDRAPLFLFSVAYSDVPLWWGVPWDSPLGRLHTAGHVCSLLHPGEGFFKASTI